ncbi:MAG: hypothetical protein IJ794_04665 [Lachnospiraceae bacterium]|nr:hypothetical protein [Lachnospiraceae bacterium]
MEEHMDKTTHMMGTKILKIFLVLIYGIGVGFTLYYAIKFCMHSTYVAYPDAMIPFTEYQRAFAIMALGCPFMAASTVSVIWAYGLRKAKHAGRKMLLLAVPAIIDAIPLTFIIGVFVVGLVMQAMREIGIPV